MSRLPATTIDSPGNAATVAVGATLHSADGDEDDDERPTAPNAGSYDLPPRFEMRREIAAGGMGTVLDVFDHAMRRRVAIKVLHASLASRVEEIALFVAEAHVTGRLDHPNIVPVHDVHIDPQRGAFFVMKLIEGDTLSALVRGGVKSDADAQGPSVSMGPPAAPSPSALRALERLLGVFVKVCEAVEFAHSRCVLHLDLKPNNVMVGSHGQVYVMDWGIAVECRRNDQGHLRPISSRRGVRGTMAYMPPEQLSPDTTELDERADIYALGGILYELLTGRPPFVALGDYRDASRLRNHVVPEPSSVHKDRLFPPGLCAIAMKALARDPEHRYASVRDMQADVEAFLRGGGWFAAKTFAPGEEIVREGEDGDTAFIIVEGECEVVQGLGAYRTTLRRMGSGEVFGETALLTAGPRTATVVACTRVTVMVVTNESLSRELAPRGWLGALVRALAFRFREADAERAALRSSRF